MRGRRGGEKNKKTRKQVEKVEMENVLVREGEKQRQKKKERRGRGERAWE